MPAIADDILKSLEVATKSLVDAIAYDGQILEDKLKYLSWISALAVACLFMIASNFSKLVPNSGAVTFPTAMMGVSITTVVACLSMGGLFHYQVIAELEDKRMRMTLLLKQQSMALSNPAIFDDQSPLYDQIWNVELLSDKDRDNFRALSKKAGARSWILFVQALLLAIGILFVFADLFKIAGTF